MAAILSGAAVLLAPSTLSAQETEIVLPITINTVPQGETPVIIAGTDIYVPVSTLERTGLTGPMWERLQLVARLRGAERKIGNERAVSLAGLAPLATFTFDEANLTLAVTVNPQMLHRSEVAITSARPEGISYRHDPGGFFNYAVTSNGSSRPSTFGETAFTAGRGLFYTGFGDTEEDGFVRGLTSWSYDQRDVLRRWTVGDAPVISDELGGSGIVGGFTVARHFDIDPYFIRYPSMSLRGVATTPSQVDVYVNGVLVSRQSIAPGPFDVQNLPAVAGPTNAQIVVRDVFGREQTQSSSFYYSTAILGRGIRDYVYSSGFVRDDVTTNFDYEQPMALAYHRYGLTDKLTVGGRVEATDEIVNGGGSVSFGSRLADLDLKLAASTGNGADTGTAVQAAVRRLSRRANLTLGYRGFSSEYQNFSLKREMDRALNEVFVSGAYLANWGNVGLQASAANMRDSGRQDRVTLLANVPLVERLDLLLSAATTRTNGADFENEYFVGFSIYGFGRNTVNIGATRTEGKNLMTAEIQQSLLLGDSWGYRVQTTGGNGEETDGSASLQYQNRFGRYEVFAPFRGDTVTGSISGGLVFEGGRVVPSRAVSQGFALVRVPGVEGVRVYVSNQLIGKTDSRGDLLLPELLSYYGNRIRIDDRDIPMNYDVQVIEQTIAPYNRGGALVQFPVRAVRPVSGSITVQKADGTSFVPAYGQITLTERSEFVSPIGGEGEFYFENLSAGTYKTLIEYEAGSCEVSINVPDQKADVIDVGRVVCKEAAKP